MQPNEPKTVKAQAFCSLCGVNVVYAGDTIPEVNAYIMQFVQGNEDHAENCPMYRAEKPRVVKTVQSGTVTITRLKRNKEQPPPQQSDTLEDCNCKSCKFERGEGYEPFEEEKLAFIEANARDWEKFMQNAGTASAVLHHYAHVIPYLIHEIRVHRVKNAAEAILKGKPS